jgi:uracil-DNA glycosylase
MPKKTKKSKKPPKFNLNKMPQVAEGFSHANEKREACQRCGLFKRCREPFGVPEIADEWTGKLLLITDPLDREAQRVVRTAYRGAGFRDSDVARIPSTRCSAGGKPSMAQLRACRPFLLKAIECLKPTYVLGLGAIALRALTNQSSANLTKARGALINLKEKKKK